MAKPMAKKSRLKKQLALFEEGKIDVSRIDMESFNKFKERLNEVSNSQFKTFILSQEFHLQAHQA
jgi:hypothetical protein